MFKRERTGIFWIGLTIVALASTVLFSTLWSSMVIYPLLNDPEFVMHIALDTGMSPRSIIDGLDWSFFQTYPWLSGNERNYFQSDHYWKFMVPPIVGASTFILIGFYMMKSGVKKEKERNTTSQTAIATAMTNDVCENRTCFDCPCNYCIRFDPIQVV